MAGVQAKYWGEKTVDGVTTRVELHEDQYAGVATERQLLRSGAVVTTDGTDGRDVYKALLATNAEVLLWDKDALIEADFDDITDQLYQLRIERNGTVIFEGYVRPEPVDTVMHAFDGEILISATCGLARMKDIPYMDAGDVFYEGSTSITQTVVRCLNKLNLGLNLYVASDWWMPDLAGSAANPDPLDYIFIDDSEWQTDDGLPISCEVVLLEICKRFNLQLRQSAGAWHLVQRELLWQPAGYYRHEYDMSGSLVSQGAYDPTVSITENDAIELRKYGSTKSFLLGYQATTMTHEHGEIPTLIPNADFSGLKDRRVRTGRPRGSIPPPGRGVGRGDVVRTPVDRRGGGSRGRGGGGRGFLGRRPGDPAQYLEHWKWEDDSALLDTDIIKGAGPDGENVVKLPRFVKGFPLLYPDPWADSLYQSLYLYNKGLTVFGGNARRLRIELTLFIDVNNQQDIPGHTYPFFWQLRLTNVNDATVEYLTMVLDGDGFNFWSQTPQPLHFGEDWNPQDRGPVVGGAIAERWNSVWYISDVIPSGVWEVEVRVHRPYDWKFDVGDDKWELKGNRAGYLTNVFVDLFDENGFMTATSKSFTAIDPNSDDLSVYELESAIGDGPIIGAGAMSYDKADLGHTVNSTEHWKVGRYSGEPDSDVGIDEMTARALWRQQSRSVRVHDADYIASGVYIHPHQVLDIDGARFQIGGGTYELLDGTWGGQLIKVIKTADAPSTDSITDHSPAGGFSASDRGASLFAIVGRNTFNSLNANYTAKTTSVITSGLHTSLDVEMSDGAVLNAGDKVVLIGPNAEYYQFTVTQNADDNDTTLQIDDDALLGSGFNFPETLDYPSFIFLRETYIRSLFIQTDNAIRAVVESMQVAKLGETIAEAELRTSITLQFPLRSNLRKGQQLILSADTPVYLTVDAPAKAGDTSLTIVQEYVKGNIGDPIVLDGSSLLAEFLITAHEIFIGVRQERRGGAIGITLDELPAGSSASWTPSNTIRLEDPTDAPVPKDTDLMLVSEDRKTLALVRNDEVVEQNDTSISIYTTNLAETIAAGASVIPAPYSSSGQIKVNKDEVEIRATFDNVIATFSDEDAERAIAVIPTDSGNKSTFDTDPLPGDIADQTEVYVIVPKNPSISAPGKSAPLNKVFQRKVQGDHDATDTTITFDSAVDIDNNPAFVMLRHGYLSQQLVTQDARITVESDRITNLVSQYSTIAIGNVSNTYTGASVSSIIIDLNSGQKINKYDTIIIFSSKDETQYEMRALEDVTGPQTNYTLSVEDVFSKGLVSINANDGDLMHLGSFSRMRQTVEGFSIHSRFLKADGFTGTIDDNGNITSIAGSGWAFGATGHLVAAKDAGNYLWWDGTDLKIAVNGDELVISSGSGLDLLASSLAPVGTRIRWLDATDTVIAELYASDTTGIFRGNDISIEATNAQLSIHGTGITLTSDINEDIHIGASGTGVIRLAAPFYMLDENTPDDPNSGEAVAYIKGGKFIIAYNDAGTVRYKYLDLTGTGVTWTHTTTAP